MTWFFAVASLLAMASQAGAEADDDYITIASQIQVADQLFQSNDSDSRSTYEEAKKALLRLRENYPDWNPDVIRFRLEYVISKLGGTPGFPLETNASPDSHPSRELKEIARLARTVEALRSENSTLEAKLREALAFGGANTNIVYRAAVDERILILQKERDLLRAVLEQKKHTSAASVKETEGKAVSKKARGMDSRSVKLQALLDKTFKQLADAESARDELELKTLRGLRNERDELRSKLEEALKWIEIRTGTAKETNSFSGSNSSERGDVLSRSGSGPEGSGPVIDEPSGADGPVRQPESAAGATRKSLKDLPAGARSIAAEAERDFEARRFEEAEKKLIEVLQQDDRNPYVFVHLAACQMELGKLEEAEKNIGRAEKIDPTDPASLTLKGILYIRNRKMDEALAALSQAAQINPTNASTQNYFGIALSEKGQTAEAEKALRNAVRLQPNYGLAHNNLAVVYGTQQPPFLELARFHYKKALALGEPKNPSLEKLLAEK